MNSFLKIVKYILTGPVQKYWVGFFADIVSRDPLNQSERGCQFCTPGQMAGFFLWFFAKMACITCIHLYHERDAG